MLLVEIVTVVMKVKCSTRRKVGLILQYAKMMWCMHECLVVTVRRFVWIRGIYLKM